jgi:TRAP transporter 4TM/12TM fusion protein
VRLGEIWGLVSEGKKRKISGKLATFIRWATVVIALYHVYYAIFTPSFDILFRANHVAIFLSLVFILYAPWRGEDKGVSIVDLILIVLAISTAVYINANADRLIFRWAYSDPVFFWDIVFGLICIVLVLEASRRVMGSAMTIIAACLVAYAFLGPWIPGIFGHRGFSLAHVIECNYLTTSGIYGVPTKVSSTMAFVFIMFGAFLKITGGGEFFFEVAQKIAGTARGGIAKTSVIASALFGSLSGSPIANAASTGAITIPMMKRAGYPAAFAAAVETAASCGGPIMPPVMGAAVFVMAEIIGIPYINIIAVALIPAIIYFAAIYVQIDSEAVRLNLRGMSREEMPKMANIWVGVIQYFVPLAFLVVRMFQGYTPTRAGLETIVLLVLFTAIRRRGKISLKEIVDALESTVRTTISVAVACSAGGIVVGVIALTGIGTKFTALVMALGQELIFLSLLLTMVISIILGLAMNITPTYILTAALAGPALTKMGLPVLSVHLFLIYYAAMGSLTPPVALTAFTAASIAGANPMEVSWKGWRLAISAFVVPFAFIYRPAMLHLTDPLASLEAIFFVCLAVYALVAAVDGWLIAIKGIVPRIVMGALFIMFMIPNLSVNLIALAVFAVMALVSRRNRRQANGVLITG